MIAHQHCSDLLKRIKSVLPSSYNRQFRLNISDPSYIINQACCYRHVEGGLDVLNIPVDDYYKWMLNVGEAAVINVLAHEYSHLVYGHLNKTPLKYNEKMTLFGEVQPISQMNEKNADKLAKFIMKKLGYTKYEICKAAISNYNFLDTKHMKYTTHPDTHDRIMEILK